MAGKFETKMDHAKDVYRQMTANGIVNRKAIIEAFIKEVKLTKAGAATYFWKINSKASKST